MQEDSQLVPFFIFGSPRSGTSLLSRMLDSHESMVVPNESLIFKMFAAHLHLYGDLSQIDNQRVLLQDILNTRVIGYWTPKPLFEDVAQRINRPGFAGVVEALICSRGKDKALEAWGEKSPGHVFYWTDIKQAFPEARVIHIVRDGRDVATSIINARMGPKTYYAAAKMWTDYLDGIARIKQDCDPRHFVEIKYEDLLENPEHNLSAICQMIGVEFSPSMLNFFQKDTNYNTDSTNSANLQKPVIASNKEKWREALSPEQLQEFETVAAEHLLKHGYQNANQLGPLPGGKLNMVKYLKSPAIRFVSRARDTQGQKEFLSIKSILLKRKLKKMLA